MATLSEDEGIRHSTNLLKHYFSFLFALSSQLSRYLFHLIFFVVTPFFTAFPKVKAYKVSR